MSARAPHFYIEGRGLTHLDRACSGGQPLATLSDAMWSAGFCPQCAPGWRLITTPNAADPGSVDIRIEVDGVATLLLAGADFTPAYDAALDPEVEAAVAAATDRFYAAVDEFMKRPVYTLPGDLACHHAGCPHLACRPDVREHVWKPHSHELKHYHECWCIASCRPEYTCQL